MPIGSYAVVPKIADELVRRQPKSVLDLGIGFGLYGAAVRQWVDMGVRPWNTLLVGVEGHGDYRNPTWNLYNDVFVGRIQDFDYQDRKWDFMIMSDVLEHFEKRDGGAEVRRAIEHLSPRGVFMVSTPAVFCEQGAAHGNELEVHRSLWTPDDMAVLGFEVLWDGQPDHFQHRMLVAKYVKR